MLGCTAPIKPHKISYWINTCGYWTYKDFYCSSGHIDIGHIETSIGPIGIPIGHTEGSTGLAKTPIGQVKISAGPIEITIGPMHISIGIFPRVHFPLH